MLALCDNIRRLRRAAGLSQEELAGRLGVSFDELMAQPTDPKPIPDGEAVTARSYDELMREASAPPPPTAPTASFTNTSAAPPETDTLTPKADERRMKAEAQYYRYLHLTLKTRTACWFLLSGGIMMLFALIVLGSLAVDHDGTSIGAAADSLGPILIMLGLSVFTGGLVAAIVYAIRAGNERRRMGDLFDLATYEELKRSGEGYATKRK